MKAEDIKRPILRNMKFRRLCVPKNESLKVQILNLESQLQEVIEKLRSTKKSLLISRIETKKLKAENKKLIDMLDKIQSGINNYFDSIK